VEINHAFLSIAMLLAPLNHFDIPTHHELHLRLEGKIRGLYRSVTRLRDPYFSHIAKDLKDIYLFPNLLKQGHPQRRGTGPGRGVGGRSEDRAVCVLDTMVFHGSCCFSEVVW